jgi:hypothetical protein
VSFCGFFFQLYMGSPFTRYRDLRTMTLFDPTTDNLTIAVIDVPHVEDRLAY